MRSPLSSPPFGASGSPFSDDPHRRLNVLTGEWVLVSPHRMRRPWQGQVEAIAPDARPAYDATCYLCPGNERAGGLRNPDYAGPYAFDNDFAALRASGSPREQNVEGLLVARQETGICRVICFSPRHDLSLPQMELPAIRGVIDLWADEYARLGARADIGHVQIFENKGEVMGSSNPHPHGQIWAQQSVPLQVAREGMAFSPAFLSATPSLGDGAEVSRRLRDDGGSAARSDAGVCGCAFA